MEETGLKLLIVERSPMGRDQNDDEDKNDAVSSLSQYGDIDNPFKIVVNGAKSPPKNKDF